MTGSCEAEDLWIFGYGSLMWRPDFPADEHRVGFIEGWARRFYQGSTDHRGTPEAPGRVVTLIRQPRKRCWGIAYRVAASRQEQVLSSLDFREKGGYQRQTAPLFSEPGTAATLTEVLFYLAGSDNANYLGPAEAEAMARQICYASGPSGRNRDYLFQLNHALRNLGVAEPHSLHLEALIRAAEKREAEALAEPPQFKN